MGYIRSSAIFLVFALAALAFAQWVPPCAKSLKGGNAGQVSACLGPQPDRTLSHGHTLDLWYDLPVGSIRVTFHGDPTNGLLNTPVASVKVIDEAKRRARYDRAVRITNAIAGITAAAYLAKTCYQLRQKPVALLNTNETQMLQACLANGF
jgi:hypothetical protein